MPKKPRQKDAIRILAERIAADLFTNGAGQRANRLVCELSDGRDGGGWCEGAVADRVEMQLRRANSESFEVPDVN